jgi:hypothetical protein
MERIRSERGDAYIQSLISDYEILIAQITDTLKYTEYALDNYRWTEHEQQDQQELVRACKADLRYFQEILDNLKGAENEGTVLTEFVEPFTKTESPKFKAITCVTVL